MRWIARLQLCALSLLLGFTAPWSAAAVGRAEPLTQSVPEFDVDGGFRVALTFGPTADGDEVQLGLIVSEAGLFPPVGSQVTHEPLVRCEDGRLSGTTEGADYLVSRFGHSDVDIWIEWRAYCNPAAFELGETVPYTLAVSQLEEFAAGTAEPLDVTLSGTYEIDFDERRGASMAAVQHVATVRVGAEPSGVESSPSEGGGSATAVVVAAVVVAASAAVAAAWIARRRAGPAAGKVGGKYTVTQLTNANRRRAEAAEETSSYRDLLAEREQGFIDELEFQRRRHNLTRQRCATSPTGELKGERSSTREAETGPDTEVAEEWSIRVHRDGTLHEVRTTTETTCEGALETSMFEEYEWPDGIRYTRMVEIEGPPGADHYREENRTIHADETAWVASQSTMIESAEHTRPHGVATDAATRPVWTWDGEAEAVIRAIRAQYRHHPFGNPTVPDQGPRSAQQR